jgi:hypothetical protein
MHEHFYNIGYSVYQNGVVSKSGSGLIRASKVPSLDSVKNHIRKHFLNDATALLSISQVTSISKEVYLMLGGNPDAPLLKESW